MRRHSIPAMKRHLLPLFFAVATLANLPQLCLGWGQDGHRITAEIAERNLTPTALAETRKILGNESLAEIATWADEIRSDPTWDFAKAYHFISINDEETWENVERVDEEEGDLLYILETLERYLRDPDSETFLLKGVSPGKSSRLKAKVEREITRRDVLAFYVHFVGDLHQPLHVGRREEQGGNRIKVLWFDAEENLHSVWDEDLIESTNLSYTEFATFLNRLTKEDRKKAAAGSYLDWAKESKEVREQVYDFGPQRSNYYLNVVDPPKLGYDYKSKNLPLIRDRLQKGGIRLAALLNEIFSEETEK